MTLYYIKGEKRVHNDPACFSLYMDVVTPRVSGSPFVKKIKSLPEGWEMCGSCDNREEPRTGPAAERCRKAVLEMMVGD